VFNLSRSLSLVLAVLVVAVVGLATSVSAQQTPTPEQARTFVGNIAGLESIGARFVAIVAPDNRAVAFLGSNDDNFNQTYAKWYVGAINGNSFVGTASDGTLLTGTRQGNTITGTVAGGQWTGTLTQAGTAGLYRNRVSDNEVDVAIVAPDGSWVGMAFNPANQQLLRTWNSGTGVVERVANSTAIRVRPAPDAPPVQLDPVVPDPGSGFCYSSPFC
jgi:hypothetical protein